MAEAVVYRCEVLETFSADDLFVLVDLGVEGLWKKQRVRLSGVDTPNAINASGTTEAGQLRTYVRNLTFRHKGKLTMVSKNASSWVCILEVETPAGMVNVNNDLIAKGYRFVRPSLEKLPTSTVESQPTQQPIKDSEATP